MATLWYYSLNGQQHGPIGAGELKRLAEVGMITPDDPVRKDGMKGWIPARRVTGLFAERPVAAPACPKCGRQLTSDAAKAGSHNECRHCQVGMVSGPVPPRSESAPSVEPMPLPPPDLNLVLNLYDLLRAEPVFVDWYLKTWHAQDGRWARCEPPRGALWSRFGITIAISWALAFTGVAVPFTVAFNIYAFWKFHGEQTLYKEWRQRVDAFVSRIGLGDALALMERAPKVGGFKQFYQYAATLLSFQPTASRQTDKDGA